MSRRIIQAIVLKDLREFWRSRTSVLATSLALGFVIAVVRTAPDVPLGGSIRAGLSPAPCANAINAALASLGSLGKREEALSMGVVIVPVADEAILRATARGTRPLEAFPVVLPDLKTITLGGELGGGAVLE